MIKVWLNVIFVLPSVTMELLNVRKKNNGTTKCDKSTIKSDISTAQCNNGTVKCEKKNRVPPNVIKVQLDVMSVLPNVKWNYQM